MSIRKNYPINVGYGKNNSILLREILTETKKHRMGEFRCKCGNIFIARINAVNNNYTLGCGCVKGNIKHLYTKHPLWNTYNLVMARCYNENLKTYKFYGGRGITMSDEFKQNPVAFIDYLTSLPNYDKRIELGLSLDRIENNKGYERGNLRWATKSEQMLNRRGKINLKYSDSQILQVRELISQGLKNKEISLILNLPIHLIADVKRKKTKQISDLVILNNVK